MVKRGRGGLEGEGWLRGGGVVKRGRRWLRGGGVVKRGRGG